MSIKMPDSMDECLYFTNRTVDSGRLTAWVYRKECPECHKAKMGKPVEKGKVKIRAAEYKCPDCGFCEPKVEHEESCTLEAIYICPYCSAKGESTAPYKRKAYQGIQSYVVECSSCHKLIPITKKLKDKKIKK